MTTPLKEKLLKEFEEKFTNLPISDSWNVAEEYKPSEVQKWLSKALDTYREQTIKEVRGVSAESDLDDVVSLANDYQTLRFQINKPVSLGGFIDFLRHIKHKDLSHLKGGKKK